MAHSQRLFDDTPSHIEEMLIQHWRTLTPAQKLAQISSMNATINQLLMAGLRQQYPGESEAQLRMRSYERRYGRALLDHLGVPAELNADV